MPPAEIQFREQHKNIIYLQVVSLNYPANPLTLWCQQISLPFSDHTLLLPIRFLRNRMEEMGSGKHF